MPKKDILYIDYVDLDEVNTWDSNPKDHDIPEIMDSYERFGFISPLIFDETTSKIVAGHGRLEGLTLSRDREEDPPKNIKVKDNKWLIPIVRGNAFQDEREAEAYVIADNRLSEKGGWIKEKLYKNLDKLIEEKGPEGLRGIGYTTEDVAKMIKKKEADDRPEIEFTEELMESHNYVVLYFDNDIDWLQAKTLLNLKTVKSLDSREGFEKQGIGRVLRGPDAIKRIQEGLDN